MGSFAKRISSPAATAWCASASKDVYKRQVQKILGHHSILTTVRYTHLTDKTKHHAIDRINGLMDSFSIDWGKVK